MDSAGAAPAGTLYVVATPIGNLDDITLRALSVLKAVALIAAEDTRTTARLLRHFDIETPLVSYHEHNETTRAPELVRRLSAGASVALVSDAGTPGVSDPGYRLVTAAAAAGVRVVPVPGALAAAAALSASGLPTDAFVFEGFLPKRPGKRAGRLNQLASEPRTIILYESPQRIAALIEAMLPVFGDRPAVLAREMTKVHEEFIRGRLSEIRSVLAGRAEIRGECTLLVAGRADPEPTSWEEAREMIRQELAHPSRGLAGLAKHVAQRCGLPRQAVYAEAVNIKAELAEADIGNGQRPNTERDPRRR